MLTKEIEFFLCEIEFLTSFQMIVVLKLNDANKALKSKIHDHKVKMLSFKLKIYEMSGHISFQKTTVRRADKNATTRSRKTKKRHSNNQKRAAAMPGEK